MKTLLMLLAVFFYSSVYSATYYFSSAGSDSYSAAQAQNAATPWKTLDQLNASFGILKAGDIIAFKRGETFFGSINILISGASSAPITFTAYGSGNKPVITGLTTVSGWSGLGGNKFEATVPLLPANLNMVVVNGLAKAAGRYPNFNAQQKGYLYFQSASGNSSITDNALSGKNFNGGEVVIRKTRWVLDRNKIQSHNGPVLSYASQSGYAADYGFGYFIQNHPSTLDEEGEWYHNSSKRFGIYTNGGLASLANVQVATADVLVNIQGQSNITFDNLSFKGSNSNTFYIKNAGQIRVTNCDLLYNGRNAITAESTNNLTVENCTIDQTNNIAFHGNGSNYTTIKGNRITNTGVLAGMGDGDSGSYEGLLISGDNNTIILNEIRNTGYIPITFSGNAIVISKNFISDYGYVKDDGGGIYTWNNGSNAPVNVNRTISGNIVLNGLGAPEGTSDVSVRFTHGIYIDDNASNVNVDGNTVANCGSYGLYIHNARDLSITKNMVYNNRVQIVMQHDDIAPNSPVANNTVSGNTFFSLKANQLVAEYKTRNNDLPNFGSFTNNYYLRPFDNTAIIHTLQRVNGTYQFQPVDLEGWKAIHGKDLNSASTPREFKTHTISQFISGNKYVNGAFAKDINGLYAFSNANNVSTSWKNNELDGGTLQVAFANTAGNNNKATVVVGIGQVNANKTYNVKFSMRGTPNLKMLDVYLRKSLSPYNDLSDRRVVKIAADRKEVSLVFTSSETQNDASIGIDVPEQVNPLYIDNVQVFEVVSTPANPQDSVLFLYNATDAAVSNPLSGKYIDVAGKEVINTIIVPAFGSAVLLQATTAPVATNPQCSATGSILLEQWDNVAGNTIASNNWNNPVSNSSELSVFEIPSHAKDYYATRARGYICAPQSGKYTFWIAGDDATELYLSTDASPANKVKIAYNVSWAGEREWYNSPTQQSAPILLEEGKKYYIEALHKEGAGGDNLAVAWRLPSGEMEAPIPGSRLSPFLINSSPLLTQTITFNPLTDVTVGGAAFPLVASASSGLPVIFRVVTGAASISGNLCTVAGAGPIVIEASQPGNAAYSSAPAVSRSFVAVANTSLACTATGFILREQWDNIAGNSLSNNNFNNPPSSTSLVNLFEGPSHSSDYYASRIRGYICPPQSGTYTFWIAGDDATELYLSTNEHPASKVKIAYNVSWAGEREWYNNPTQQSAAIYMEVGKKYYVEAWHKEGAGGDNLAVAWKLPNGTFEGPIPGKYLAPFTLPNSLATQSITFSQPADIIVGSSAISLVATSTSGLPISFKIVNGPGTLINNMLTATGTGTIVIEATQAGNNAYSPATPVLGNINVVAAGNVCSATGSILKEVWTNVYGNNIWDNDYNTSSNGTTVLTLFEAPTNIADNYATRIRGYICPPQDGLYTFWIAGDDASELYLSTDQLPSNKTKIAFIQSWTNPREWNKFASQQSGAILLKAGKSYYIEAIHKEGWGGDNLAVGWELPGGIKEMPIPGNRLSAYQPPSFHSKAKGQKPTAAPVLEHLEEIKIFPNPVTTAAKLIYTQQHSGMLTITLKDLQGRIVRKLFSGNLAAGAKQTVYLNAQGVANGVYSVHLIAPQHKSSVKVIVAH